MRFKVSLQINGNSGNILPINYQYEFSAWIYHTIYNVDPVFSGCLHREGYSTGAQRFKFFTFSNLEIPYGGYKVDGDRLKITAGSCSIQISFLIGEAAMPFITGVFQNQDFTIGDTKSRVSFRVSTVERMADPVFGTEMVFHTLSPIVVGKSRLAEEGKGTAYLSPEDEDYGRLFFQNLSRKVSISQPETTITPDQLTACKFDLLDKPRSKKIEIKSSTAKPTSVIGYLYCFRLTAPPNWIRIGYFAGFGEKNGVGMDCVKINLKHEGKPTKQLIMGGW